MSTQGQRLGDNYGHYLGKDFNHHWGETLFVLEDSSVINKSHFLWHSPHPQLFLSLGLICKTDPEDPVCLSSLLIHLISERSPGESGMTLGCSLGWLPVIALPPHSFGGLTRL